MSEAPVIAMLLDPDQAREVLRYLVECLEAKEVRSIVLLGTAEPVPMPVLSVDDLPEPDIIMQGVVTVVGTPVTVEEYAAVMEKRYQNPTEN